MSQQSSKGLDAQKLRLVLLVTLLAILVIGIAGFVFARKQVIGYASEVAQATSDQKVSDDNLSALQAIKSTLANNQDAIKRTSELVADSKQYAYQDQIISDVNTYATKANVSINGFTFTSDTSATNTSGTTSGGSAATSTQTTGTAAINGLKTVSVAVDVKSPVDYASIMNFIHYLELNLTKMQLQGVSLTRDPASGNITAGSLNLEVYVR